MEYVAVKVEANWADEFDCEVVEFMKKDKYLRLRDQILENFDPTQEHYFGTNEYVTFETLEELLDCVEVKDISEETYKSMVAFLGKSFGTGVSFSELAES